MRREGSPWSGLWAVVSKEAADHLTSARMRFLEVLVGLAAIGAVYAATQTIRETVGSDPFLFLTLFTTAKEPLPSFVSFLGFLVPLAAIALGFDAINTEHSRRTLSRIVAQPIYRDALLMGKFLAALLTLGILLAVLWLVVMGLGPIVLGLPPSGEEIARAFTFWAATLFYGGVWLALSMMFSVIFRQPATSALAALAIWLFFAFFWPIIAQLAAQSMVPEQAPGFIAQTYLAVYEPMFARVSPNYLFGETTLALLNPATRSLGPIFLGQLQGALLGAPIPFGQSVLLIWPHFTGLVAGTILLFTVTYVAFQRQEIRA
jgi:ABC-2 type transport system permease protein